MNLVLSWLKDYVDIDLSITELAHALTMLGLEVENVRLVGLPEPEGDTTGVTFQGLPWNKEKFIVAQVDEVMPHPDADRLVLCKLFDGKEELIVLTGAPNLYPFKGKGKLDHPLKVAYAREGSELYDGHKPGKVLTKLKRMKIRGVESFSMICSEKELGISEEHEGVIILDDDAPVGVPLSEYMGDAVFEIAILPNMVHCANVIGVAREVAAYTNKEFKFPDLTLPAGSDPIDGKVSVEITKPELNPRFIVGLLKNVTAKSSPYWVQYRLRLAGMRPINAIVDATNYVMMDAGQPLHAFDYDVLVKRAGGEAPTIITRTPEKNEKLTTLDGVERKLDPYNELVCDTAGALSIAGVMGGLESEVTAETTNVLLESANWNFINIRQTIAFQRMNTEASYRNSRNLHPEIARVGAILGLQRMAEWGGGNIATGLLDIYPREFISPTITISEEDTQRMLGIDIDAHEIADLLTRLEFVCEVKGDVIHTKAPNYRTDIAEGVVGKADVIEEIARLYGYDRIPSTRLQAELPPQRVNAAEERDRTIQNLLVSIGLQEVISYRLTNPDAEARLYPPESKPETPKYVELKNPIAVEKRVLRRSLLASVLEALEHNIRLRERLQLFELGPVFIPDESQELPHELARLAIALSGKRYPIAWDDKTVQEYDFYDMKGIIESILKALQINDYTIMAADAPTFHPGKCALLSINGDPIGVFGALHPLVKVNYAFLEPDIIAADLDLDALIAHAPQSFKAETLVAFPSVIEDLAMIVPEATLSADIEAVITKQGGFLLKKVDLFDIFRAEQIGAGMKSMAYRLTYQAPNRTLTDKDVGKLRERIIQQLEKELGAKVRKAE
jgi:phenylalanyl-tRNA synthetase beta chain